MKFLELFDFSSLKQLFFYTATAVLLSWACSNSALSRQGWIPRATAESQTMAPQNYAHIVEAPFCSKD